MRVKNYAQHTQARTNTRARTHTHTHTHSHTHLQRLQVKPSVKKSHAVHRHTQTHKQTCTHFPRVAQAHLCPHLLQGKRRYDRKQSGYGGQTKPIFHKKAKTTKKIVLRMQVSLAAACPKVNCCVVNESL